MEFGKMGKTKQFVEKVNSNRQYWEEIYLSKSLTEFCCLLGVSVESSGNLMKELGWGREFKREQTYKRLKCWLDEETDLKYYFLGYFVGDGSLRKPRDKYAREYVLYSKDIEVLEVFAKKMEVPIKSRRNKKSENEEYSVCSYNRKEWDWLYNWGIRPNKSELGMTLGFIPEEFKFSFLRGLLDADGSVRTSPNRKRVSEFIWMGHESYMTQVREMLQETYNPTIRVDKTLTVISIGRKEEVFDIRNKMYTGLCLSRKREKAFTGE